MPANGALHGLALDRLMKINLITIAVLFVVAHLLLGITLLKRRREASLPRFSRAELFPLIALCGLYIWTAITAQRLWAVDRFEGPSPTAMQVEVVGVQFQWYFRYPGQDATFGATSPMLVNAGAGNPLGIDPKDPQGSDDIVSSELVLPAGREVDLRLSAHDVIHGFFIPGMRLKQNAVPGLTLHVHFTPIDARRISNPLHSGLRPRPRPHGSQTPRRATEQNSNNGSAQREQKRLAEQSRCRRWIMSADSRATPGAKRWP